MLHNCVYLLIAYILGSTAYAFSADSPLPNATQEKQAKEIFHEIRCLVCEGESIADSNASLAQDLRMLIRADVEKGMNGQEIKTYLADRYGDAILMETPVSTRTYPLWILPLLVLLAGGLLLRTTFRKGASQ